MRMLFTVVIFPLMACAAIDKAYIAVSVMDSVNRKPLSGVKIIASFADDIGWRAWTESPKPDIVEGVTDANGFCRLGGKTNCGRSSCWIAKRMVWPNLGLSLMP